MALANFNPAPKVPAGRVTLAEERAQKRLARVSGPTAKARASKRRVVVKGERANKQIVRERDQSCRWPECDCWEIRNLEWATLECAHLDDKGIGGDPQLLRSQPDAMILLCRWQHQGPFGLHAGRARVERLTADGTNGPCEFFRCEGESGRWYSVGITSPPGEAQ